LKRLRFLTNNSRYSAYIQGRAGAERHLHGRNLCPPSRRVRGGAVGPPPRRGRSGECPMMIAHREKSGALASATVNGDATVAAKGPSLPKLLFGYEVIEFIGQGA